MLLQNPRHEKVMLDPAALEKAMKSYHQVRSTAVHKEKVGFTD